MAKRSKKIEAVPATPALKSAIKMFNGEASAETALIEDQPKKLQVSNNVKTLNDKFFDFIEDKRTGTAIALAVTTAVVCLLIYWVMNQ